MEDFFLLSFFFFFFPFSFFAEKLHGAGVTVLDRDRRNGIPGQSSERRMGRVDGMDAPGVGRRCLPGSCGRAEGEAAQMPRRVHLHQR